VKTTRRNFLKFLGGLVPATIIAKNFPDVVAPEPAPVPVPPVLPPALPLPTPPVVQHLYSEGIMRISSGSAQGVMVPNWYRVRNVEIESEEVFDYQNMEFTANIPWPNRRFFGGPTILDGIDKERRDNALARFLPSSGSRLAQRTRDDEL
jgi:hypothetical protein